MAYGPYPDMDALAQAIADDLCVKTAAPVEANPAIVKRIVAAAIEENFRIEREIHEAAERALAELGTAAAGMDRGKLLAGIRERIAKQRGFVL